MKLFNFILVAITISLLGYAPEARAQAIAEVAVFGNFDEQGAVAVGFIISASGTIQKLKTTTKRTSESITQVGFEYDQAELKPDSVATALIVSADGAYHTGEVRPLFSGAPAESLAGLPQCNEPLQASHLVLGQVALIQSLVELRANRRNNTYLQVARILDGPFLERLRKLERGFGIERANPLSADLNPYELIDRLTRIIAAVRTYEKAKGAAEANGGETEAR